MSHFKQLKLKEAVITSAAQAKQISIVPQNISGIEISETILEPGIVGFIDILDYQGIEEIGGVFAGDTITIVWGGTDDKDENLIKATFTIYCCEDNDLLPKQTYVTTRYGFCSPWVIDAFTRQISRVWENKTTTDMIQDLVKECGGTIGFVEESLTTLEKFVSPLWSPYRTIAYLMEISRSLDGNGYLCWTDLRTGKVNITTLNYLMSGKLGHTNSAYPFKSHVENPRYQSLIKDMTIESKYDIIRLVSAGLPSLKLIGFNFDEGKPINTKTSVTGLSNKHLSKHFPIPKKYLDKKYTTTKRTGVFPQTAEPTFHESQVLGLIENQLNHKYSMMATDIFKLNIYTIGEITRRAGWVADLDYVSQNVGSNAGNESMKGEYLICNINHMFAPMIDYTQVITLISDGYKQHKHPDMMRW
jgi:hypothetical protein